MCAALQFTGWLGLALGLFSLVYCAFSISVGYFMIRSDAYYDMPPSRAYACVPRCCVPGLLRTDGLRLWLSLSTVQELPVHGQPPQV